MSTLRTTVRGNVVSFSASPLDVNGSPTTPASVSLLLAYGPNAAQTTEVPMTLSGGAWTATWDSSEAPQGWVYWSVRASNPEGAQDGQFFLTANPANMSE